MAISSRQNLVTEEGFLAFLRPDPRTFGSPVRTFIHAFRRTGTVQEPTGTGYANSFDGLGTVDLSLSMSSGIFTVGLPRTTTTVAGLTNYDYQIYSCDTRFCSALTVSNPVMVDSTETGIALLRESPVSSPPYRLGHDNDDCCGFATAPTAIWNVSTPTTRRLAWLTGTTLRVATRGASTWTSAAVLGAPSTIDVLRAAPDGGLATINAVSGGLEVRFQALSWAAVQLSLPPGAVWKAKFDFDGVFRVVSSHATTGTVLHTLQGDRFASEVVAAQGFSKVDFTVLPDKQAVVVGANTDLLLFR